MAQLLRGLLERLALRTGAVYPNGLCRLMDAEKFSFENRDLSEWNFTEQDILASACTDKTDFVELWTISDSPSIFYRQS